MGAAVAAVIVDEITGEPRMVVVPDFDSQLSDPSFNPPGTKQIRVKIDTYKALDHEGLKAIIEAAKENKP